MRRALHTRTVFHGGHFVSVGGVGGKDGKCEQRQLNIKSECCGLWWFHMLLLAPDTHLSHIQALTHTMITQETDGAHQRFDLHSLSQKQNLAIWGGVSVARWRSLGLGWFWLVFLVLWFFHILNKLQRCTTAKTVSLKCECRGCYGQGHIQQCFGWLRYSSIFTGAKVQPKKCSGFRPMQGSLPMMHPGTCRCCLHGSTWRRTLLSVLLFIAVNVNTDSHAQKIWR